MKNVVLVIAIFFTLIRSYSQVKYDAYIITLAGDTVLGKIEIPVKSGALSFAQINEKIRFNDSSGFKFYKPADLKGFGIIEDGLTGDYLSFRVPNTSRALVPIKKSHFFLKRIVDGDWQMYDHLLSETRTLPGAPAGPNGLPHAGITVNVGDGKTYYILIKDEPVKLERDVTSGKMDLWQLKKIFAGQPEILDKLNAELEWFHLRDILETYNQAHLSPE